MTTSIDDTSTVVAQLSNELSGRVITPEDPNYDDARTVFYGDVDRRPAAIAEVADVNDVQRVVRAARDSGLPLAVRSGGHSVAGLSVCDGGIVLDTTNLTSLDIDVDGRTVWAGGGWTAGALTAAVGEHGLAIGFGDTGSVGVAGITLGGGVGFLSRKHGLTIDNLLAAELVTADGSVVQASESENPDLFWAIRGGGGNLGVVTRFKFRLHEVPGIVGGMLVLPATADVIAGFVAEAEAAPEELSGIVNVMVAPPLPFLPAELHGSLIVMALLCYAGDADSGEQALAPFRALATPMADMLRPMPYSGMFPPEQVEYHPTAVSKNMFIDRVDGDVAETILAHLNASDAPVRVAQLRVLGGAVSRVPSDATAYAHRASRIMANIAAFYTGPEDKPAKQAWVDGLSAALQQGDDGVYVNFLADEGEARVRAAYPGDTWDRLAAIKAQYDPTNLFRLNQNVPPAPGAAS